MQPSILWSGSRAPPQHDASTPMLHGWDGVLQLAILPLFPPNITMVIMAKQFYFCFIRPEGISPKVRSLSSRAVANRSLAFLWRFWSNGFFLAERPFRLCGYRSRFTVDIDTFVHVSSSIFTRSFVVVLGLHFSHQNMFISRRQSASPSWAVWQLRGPVVFILAYYCLYRWTWYLQAFGNCSQGWTRLMEVYHSFF